MRLAQLSLNAIRILWTFYIGVRCFVIHMGIDTLPAAGGTGSAGLGLTCDRDPPRPCPLVVLPGEDERFFFEQLFLTIHHFHCANAIVA